jgi:CDP-diacylglycerol--glycerol-3-phosphate 3-phosphatidyltransferase
VVAAAIFAIAALTDFVDGKIARSRNLVTNLGKFLDPIADKVLVSTAFILLLTITDLFAFMGGAAYGVYVAVVICICVIMARELIISAFRQVAAAAGIVLAAEKLGKYKTFAQDTCLVVFFVAADLSGMAATIVTSIALGIFAIATVLTIVSGCSYVLKNKQVLKESK